ncbi:MAG: hypothetical protein ACREX3_00600 [Gammaproteobacteria bacterium]
MMQTAYSGTKGDCPRYACSRAAQLYGAERHCQSLGGRRLEQRVLDEVFAVLAPAALAATAKALGEAEAQHRQRLAVFELAVERSRFEAERARRQFDAMEPENRLVGRTLERTWEQALVAQRRAEADLSAQRARQPTRLTDEEVAWLARAGADVRAVFNAPTTTWRERKQLLRAVIAEVVVTVRAADRQADIQIIWEGGPPTASCGHSTRSAGTSGPPTRTRSPWCAGSPSAMTTRRSPRSSPSTAAGRGRGCPSIAAASARCATPHGIAVFDPQAAVTPSDDDGEVVTIYQAERILGVDHSTIHRWLHSGFIDGEQLAAGGPWRLRITDELRRRIVPEVPDGWLPLDQAARVLGVARQTVLHKVQRGELDAVHVNRGKRKGLRIKVFGDSPGLFATTE